MKFIGNNDADFAHDLKLTLVSSYSLALKQQPVTNRCCCFSTNRFLIVKDYSCIGYISQSPSFLKPPSALPRERQKGSANIPWAVTTLISGAIATYFLSLALLTFDVGVGYALWTSLAGVGIVIIGALALSQKLTWQKLLGTAIVIIGVVGLNLAGSV